MGRGSGEYAVNSQNNLDFAFTGPGEVVGVYKVLRPQVTKRTRTKREGWQEDHLYQLRIAVTECSYAEEPSIILLLLWVLRHAPCTDVAENVLNFLDEAWDSEFTPAHNKRQAPSDRASACDPPLQPVRWDGTLLGVR